jgi:hypothetical protein
MESSQQPQLTDQERKRLDRIKRFGQISNPVLGSNGEPVENQGDQEVPMVLPPVNKERINITRRNWR